jgi:hypothetical protein
VLLTVAVVVSAGCGSWRKKIEAHMPLPSAGDDVPAHIVAASGLVDRAVLAVDRHAHLETLYHPDRRPQLFKVVRVLYGSSLDTFAPVLDQWLRTHGGTVASWKEIGGRGEAPGLLVKIVVRVPEKVAVWLEVRRRMPGSVRTGKQGRQET